MKKTLQRVLGLLLGAVVAVSGPAVFLQSSASADTGAAASVRSRTMKLKVDTYDYNSYIVARWSNYGSTRCRIKNYGSRRYKTYKWKYDVRIKTSDGSTAAHKKLSSTSHRFMIGENGVHTIYVRPYVTYKYKYKKNGRIRTKSRTKYGLRVSMKFDIDNREVVPSDDVKVTTSGSDVTVSFRMDTHNGNTPHATVTVTPSDGGNGGSEEVSGNGEHTVTIHAGSADRYTVKIEVRYKNRCSVTVTSTYETEVKAED